MASLLVFAARGCCLAIGLDDAGRHGANAKAKASNPINKSRFISSSFVAFVQ
jgi:hypothetical protein